jgi:hypothetical protein
MRNIPHHFLFFLALSYGLAFPATAHAQRPPESRPEIFFEEGVYSFAETETALITEIIETSAQDIRALLPSLPRKIIFTLEIIDRNIDIVGGVTGRSEAHSPVGDVRLQLSKAYPGGIAGAARAGLESAIYHELHHLARGWTLTGNRYGPGIPTAAVNEGLAVVFAEIYTGVREEGNSFPEEADAWVREILTLPKDADYMQWVSGIHPDGRSYIGYRAGNYLVRKALRRSGKTVLELSEMTPEAILELAGYEVPQDPDQAGPH